MTVRVGINDSADTATLVDLLQYDSTYRVLPERVGHTEDSYTNARGLSSPAGAVS